jgi:excisionase family DNA binding protein
MFLNEEWVRRVIGEAVSIAVRGGKDAPEALAQGAPRLTKIEAAALAKVDSSTIRRWVRAGRLKQHGVGRQARFDRDELLACQAASGSRKPEDDTDAFVEAVLAR